MKYILAIDVGEDNPALIGPAPKGMAEAKGEDLNKRWGLAYEIWPLYSSWGEYLRETEGLSD